jgi:hypothetical protein
MLETGGEEPVTVSIGVDGIEGNSCISGANFTNKESIYPV